MSESTQVDPASNHVPLPQGTEADSRVPIGEAPGSSYVGERLARWRHQTDSALFLFAAASIPLVLLEVQRSELSAADQRFVDVVNVMIFLVFLIDYIVEVVKSENRWAYVKGEWLLGLVVLTSAIALIPAAWALSAFRLVRLLRPISGLVRVVSVAGVVIQDGKRLLRHRIVRSAFMMGGLVWAASAAAFMLAEGTGADGPVDGYADALWWSFTAMLAGESYAIEPLTLAGKLITAFTMIVGLAIFAAVIARVAAFLVVDPDEQPSARDR
jgi:voltage-gated potassium channel